MADSLNVHSLLKRGEAFLKSNKLPDPKSEAEYLLSSAMKIKRSHLAIVGDRPAGEKETELFNGYILRRSKREPAAYITGSCGFMGLEFKVNRTVLIPRPETELLVEEVLKISARKKYETVLDLCTGSGCIAVSLSKLGDFREIYAADISSDSLATAKENAVLNGAENTEFFLSDMFEALENIKADCIVSNPPYVSEAEYEELEPELKFEPKQALVAAGEGLFFYNEIASQAPSYLNDGGYVFVELNANIAARIKTVFEKYGFKDIEITGDYSGLPRILKAHL